MGCPFCALLTGFSFQSSLPRSIRPCSKVRVSIFSIGETTTPPEPESIRDRNSLSKDNGTNHVTLSSRSKLGLWIRKLREARGCGEGHQHVERPAAAEQSHQGFIGPPELRVDQGCQSVRVWPAQVHDSARPGGSVHTVRQDNHVTDLVRQHVR